MRCPYCTAADSKVVDSRDSETGEAIRRRRECLGCGKRFTTYERVERVPLFIVKKDGRREEFDRHKLLIGLRVASTKREIAPYQLEALVDDVENAMRSRNLAEVPSRDVGEAVMDRLRDLDEIAYIRFASVYRRFKDAADMRAVMEDVLARPPGTRAEPGRRARRPKDDTTTLLDLEK